MKIAFLRYPDGLYVSGRIIRGGSEIANQLIIDGLRSKGIEVVEFAPETEARIGLMAIPAIGTPLMFQELQKKIDEINSCDIVVTTNWFGAILPEIKKPLVTIFHSDSNLVQDAVSPKSIKDQKVLSKWLVRAQQCEVGGKSTQQQHEQIIALEEKYFVENSNLIIAVSDFLKRSLIEHYGADKDKIKVILNAYPASWNEIDANSDFMADQLELITVTRMPSDYSGFVSKGIYRLFEVFSRDKLCRKTLLGATTPDVYDKFIQNYLPRINFIENASRDTVGQELAKAHISLHCSRAEACQMTLIEAMKMKTVPITYPVGVAPELIIHGKNGFIINNEKEALRCIRYLDKNRVIAENIAEAAQRTITNRLDQSNIASRYIDALKSLLI